LENRVRELIAAALEPVAALQRDQIFLIEDNRKKWLGLDFKTDKAADSCTRAAKELVEYKTLESRLNSFVAALNATEQKLDADLQMTSMRVEGLKTE